MFNLVEFSSQKKVQRSKNKHYDFMKNFLFRTGLMLFIVITAGSINAQTAAGTGDYPFNDPNLAIDERAQDLISRLTLEEKMQKKVDRGCTQTTQNLIFRN